MKNYLKLIISVVFATNIMAQNIPSYVPKDGLVGWWPFNGNANDESGNGNNGIQTNITYGNDRFGNYKSTLEIIGQPNRIVTIQNPTNLNSNKKTFSAWIKFPFSLNSGLWYNHIILCEPSIGNATWMGIMGNNPTYIQDGRIYKFNYTGLGQPQEDPTELFNTNTWRHIVCIADMDSALCKYYFDGIYAGSKEITIDQNLTQWNTIKFGNNLSDTHAAFAGTLDDIGIWNRVLTEQEVKQLYEGCTKETATSNSFNSVVYTTNASLNLTATPAEGTFSGVAIENNSFNPSKGKLGINKVKYTFKNSTGCADSTNFEMILVDTLGNKCTETIYDTIKVKESTYDTLKIKIQLTTGIKTGQLASMNVYPNPTSDVLIIEASDVAALNGYNYKMVDLQGKQVYKELVTKSKTEISLKNIGAKGVYILHVLDAQGVSIENKKIVLE